LAFQYNGGQVMDGSTGSLVVEQPFSFGTVLWAIGGIATVLMLAFVFMVLFNNTKIEGTGKHTVPWKTAERSDPEYDYVLNQFERDSGYKLR
jgi:hypothetical protein